MTLPDDPLIAFYLVFAVVFCVLLIGWPAFYLVRRRLRIWRSRRYLRWTMREALQARLRRDAQPEMVGDTLLDAIRSRYDGKAPLRMVKK